jgi:hypothetical protein
LLFLGPEVCVQRGREIEAHAHAAASLADKRGSPRLHDYFTISIGKKLSIMRLAHECLPHLINSLPHDFTGV